MTTKAEVLKKAEFNPDIKRYLLMLGILILFVSIVGIPLMLLWIPIAPYFINKYYDRLECELTTRSLRFQKGYIFHTEKNVPLDKIQDLTFKEGPILKMFGLSILKIETAGNNPQGSSDMTLIGIVEAADFRNRVLEQRDIVTDKPVVGSETTDQENALTILKEIRDSLQRLEQKLG